MDLAELIERHGPLPPERVIHLLRQVCHALSEAHSIGFVHRDVKPGNIFVAHRGGSYDVAKVLDFGLVRSPAHLEETQLTHDGALAGSPLYMSPEQASGQSEPDARSDIYSLGAVAYHILTGRPPFEETTPMKVIIAHARDQVLPPSKHRPGIPRRLEQIVVRCLAKVPGERFQDVESLDQALAACETDQPWTQTRAAEWWQQAEPQRASDDSSAMSQQMESNRRRVGQESGRD